MSDVLNNEDFSWQMVQGGDGGDGSSSSDDGPGDHGVGPALTGAPNTADPGPGPVDSGAMASADPNDFNAMWADQNNAAGMLGAFTGMVGVGQPSSGTGLSFGDLMGGSFDQRGGGFSFNDGSGSTTSVGGPPAFESFTGSNPGAEGNEGAGAGGDFAGGAPLSGSSAPFETGGPPQATPADLDQLANPGRGDQPIGPGTPSALPTGAQPSPTDQGIFGPGNITFNNNAGGPTGPTGGNSTGNFGGSSGGGDTGGLPLRRQAIPSNGFGMGGGVAPGIGAGMLFNPSNPNWQGNPNWFQGLGGNNPAAGGNLGAVLSALGGGTGGFGGGR